MTFTSSVRFTRTLPRPPARIAQGEIWFEGERLDGVPAHQIVTRGIAHSPEGRRLFDMLRKGDTLVVRWVDRLGRNYADVTDTIREFMRRGVIIRTVINSMTFDGATNPAMRCRLQSSLIFPPKHRGAGGAPPFYGFMRRLERRSHCNGCGCAGSE